MHLGKTWLIKGYLHGQYKLKLVQNAKAFWLLKKKKEGLPGGSGVKSLPAHVRIPGDLDLISGLGGSLEEEMITNSSTLDWRTPCTEEPGGLQSTGLQRVEHDWETEHASIIGEKCKRKGFWEQKKESLREIWNGLIKTPLS